MKHELNSYYCYLQSNSPVIQTRKPANFKQLPFHYLAYCPNDEIARITYEANLRIMKMRKGEN